MSVYAKFVLRFCEILSAGEIIEKMNGKPKT